MTLIYYSWLLTILVIRIVASMKIPCNETSDSLPNLTDRDSNHDDDERFYEQIIHMILEWLENESNESSSYLSGDKARQSYHSDQSNPDLSQKRRPGRVRGRPEWGKYSQSYKRVPGYKYHGSFNQPPVYGSPEYLPDSIGYDPINYQSPWAPINEFQQPVLTNYHDYGMVQPFKVFSLPASYHQAEKHPQKKHHHEHNHDHKHEHHHHHPVIHRKHKQTVYHHIPVPIPVPVYKHHHQQQHNDHHDTKPWIWGIALAVGLPLVLGGLLLPLGLIALLTLVTLIAVLRGGAAGLGGGAGTALIPIVSGSTTGRARRSVLYPHLSDERTLDALYSFIIQCIARNKF